jgi:hypothetical protein
MNENHALMAIVGAVIAVGVFGMIWSSSPDQITGYSPTETVPVSFTTNSEVTIQFDPLANSLDFDIDDVNFVPGDTVRFNTEGTCLNTVSLEICGDYTVTGSLIFEVGGNVPATEVVISGDTETPLGAGSTWKTKIEQILAPAQDPLTAQCIAQTAYTLVDTDPVDLIYWTPSAREFKIHVETVYFPSVFGAGTSTAALTVTGSEAGAAPPGCMIDIPVP